MAALVQVERKFASRRMLKPAPRGNFDAKHLKAIHKHIFQDVYEWAGEFRTVPLALPGQQFMPPEDLERGMSIIHQRLRSMRFLKGSDRKTFSDHAGRTIGDVNLLHPFRDGNGRTQRTFLKHLARNAGYEWDESKMSKHVWLQASYLACDGDYRLMSAAIKSGLSGRVNVRDQFKRSGRRM
ncbi:MAG: Fic family protein [Pseudomonadota bacterium]